MSGGNGLEGEGLPYRLQVGFKNGGLLGAAHLGRRGKMEIEVGVLELEKAGGRCEVELKKEERL